MITDFFKRSPVKKKQKVEHTSEDEAENEQKENIQQKRKPSDNECVDVKKKKTKLDGDQSSSSSSSSSGAPDDEEEQNKSFAYLDSTLHESWRNELRAEFSKSYFANLRKKLLVEEKSGAEIFPPRELVYKAFEHCPWDQLKVVIIGQDPYHDNNQAEGLCFSVPIGVKVPSSLRNIIKELVSDDVPFKRPSPPHGHLSNWAKQGVLLLNTCLTVRAHNANSHKKYGWQTFTDAVIRKIAQKKENIVFILWGKQAEKKCSFISSKKHFIVKSPHPSGLSAHRGFFGSKPFSKTNAYLKERGMDEIDWQI